jgi:hypothetical protein
MTLGKSLIYKGDKYILMAIVEDGGKKWLFLGKDGQSIEDCLRIESEELNPKKPLP